MAQNLLDESENKEYESDENQDVKKKSGKVVSSTDKGNREASKISKSPHKESKSSHKETIKRIQNKGKRKLLKCLGATVLATTVSNIVGCYDYLPIEDQFFNNFDYRDYEAFDHSDYEKDRDLLQMTSRDVTKSLQTAIDTRSKLRIDVDEFFEFTVDGNKVFYELKPKNESEIERILKNQGIFPDSVEIEGGHKDILVKIIINDEPYNIILTDSNIDIRERGNYDQTLGISMYTDQKNGIATVYSGYYSDMKNQSKKALIVESEHVSYGENRSLTVDINKPPEYKKDNEQIILNNTEDFINFLEDCKSTKMIEKVLLYGNVDLRDIKDISELIEIYRLMPRDPLAIGKLMKATVVYRDADKGLEDEFRDPVKTIQLGFGDCDDFAVLFYFWAYLHGYSPNLVYLKSIKEDKDNHVFVWMEDENQDIFIQATSYVKKLVNGESIEEYIDENYSDDFTVEFNKHL